MDGSFAREWVAPKYDASETPAHGNVASSWQWRELGITPKGSASNTTILQEAAEDHLVNKVHLNERCCEVPGIPRSTFLMVFSPDGTKVASTHGNHNVYVSELSSGKHVRTLSGHPRTPWCVAFHPSHTQLLGSGCLGGQVRVWDLSGGSEVWTVGGETVIASIAFHPRDQLLVIATYNELYFWDWSQPQPFTKVQTNTIKEKVRFVSFDALGHKLITGISVWSLPGASGSLLHPQSVHMQGPSSYVPNQPSTGNSHQDQISTYQQLLQRYDILVRNYRQLFMARSQLTNTTDRGTDPMEVDWAGPQPSTSSGPSRLPRSPAPADEPPPVVTPSASTNSGGNSEAPNSSPSTSNKRVPVFDATPYQAYLSGANPSYTPLGDRHMSHSLLGSHLSAFQPPRHTVSRPAGEEPPQFEYNRLPPEFVEPDVPPGGADSNSSQTSYIRSELTASLNRLQGFMENSIDETLSFWERYETARTSPNYDQNLPVDPLIELIRRNHPIEATTERTDSTASVNPARSETNRDSSHEARPFIINCRNLIPPNGDNSQTEGRRNVHNTEQPPRRNTPYESARPAPYTVPQRLETIGDILRDSGNRLLNLITDITDSNTNVMERQILLNTRQQHQRRIASALSRDRANLEAEMSGGGLFSSDDGSDSDREMFSPLPLHIYRTRNWNAPRSSNSSNSQGQMGSSTAGNQVSGGDSSVHASSIPRYIGREPNGGLGHSFGESGRPSSEPGRSSMEPGGSSGEPGHSSGEPPRDRLFFGRVDFRESSSQLMTMLRDYRLPFPPPSTSNRNENLIDRETPSTSRQSQSSARTRPSAVTPEQRERESQTTDAFQKVTRGVAAIERHMEALIVLWSGNSTRPPMRQLRRMWEDLRREMLTLQRPSMAGNSPSSYFSLTALSRCNLLSGMTPERNRSSRFSRGSSSSPSSSPSVLRRNQNNVEDNNTVEIESPSSSTNVGNEETSAPNANMNSNENPQSPDSESSNATDNRNSNLDMPSTSSGITHSRQAQPTQPGNSQPKTYPPSSKLKPNNLRTMIRDHNQSMKRRLRSIVLNRITHGNLQTWQRSHPGRGLKRTRVSRTSSAFMPRRHELELTRDSIRLHARRVLAIMFSIMMHCLEADQLGNLIIAMLRSLKKSLGLTCLLLMSHPFPNVSRPSNSSNPSTSQETPNPPMEPSTNTNNEAPSAPSVTSQPDIETEPLQSEIPASTSWSDRVAIQISAVNRNDSSNAKRRKERYQQVKKARALRNCNPTSRSLLFRKEAFQQRSFKSSSTLSSSSRQPQPSDNAVPSTSGLQNRTNEMSSETAPSAPPRPASRTIGPLSRQFHNVDLARRIHSRMLFRRYLYNHGFMRDLLGVFRRAEQNRNQLAADMEAAAFQSPSRHRIFTLRRSTHRGALVPGEEGFDPANNVVVPLVQVNDMPVSDMIQNPDGPPPLQPIIYQNVLAMDDIGRSNILDDNPRILTETQASPVHRIQVWDFTQGKIPDISNANKNIVVHRCKIHNDASIDISKDGRLLVALLPAQRMRSLTHRLGIYSLDWSCLGDCLYTALLEQNAVSVSLSPCARHLAVGLGSRRVSLQPYGRNGIMALIFRLGGLKKNEHEARHGCLIPMRTLEQSWELGFTSLNCLRWAPQPGQGLVYANNTGQLKILS